MSPAAQSIGRCMRIVTWNVNRAHHRRNTWDFAMSLDADVLLAQESGELPKDRFPGYQMVARKTLRRRGGEQPTCAALLIKGAIRAEVQLAVRPDYGYLLERTRNNMYAFVVDLDCGKRIGVLHAYSPPWPLERLDDVEVWMTQLLADAVGRLESIDDIPWIVAGDLNLSETFDLRTKKPRGNRAFLDAMEDAGLTECLRFSRGKLTPTYLHTNGEIAHQIDHLFANGSLVTRLKSCDTAPPELIFTPRPRLSDHLPIIADFD